MYYSILVLADTRKMNLGKYWSTLFYINYLFQGKNTKAEGKEACYDTGRLPNGPFVILPRENLNNPKLPLQMSK